MSCFGRSIGFFNEVKGMDKNMKKFIIVIVFIFLIAILISFNYLLWDREKQLESYQNMRQSNNLTIETLSEKMNNLDRLNKELTTKLETITNDNEITRKHSSALNNENADLKKEIQLRNDMIITLKKNIDATSMNTVIKKWTDSINSKSYESAQAFISKNAEDETLVGDVNALKEMYQKEIKEIKLKSSEPYINLTYVDENIMKIQLKAVFEVIKPAPTANNEEVEGSIFKSGSNEKFITMEFNSYTNEWMMLEIKNEP
jgi:preprotein translocase subunit SecG